MTRKNHTNNEQENGSRITGVVEKNVRALVERRIKEEKQKSVEAKVADTFANFTGNMAFVYTHAAIFSIWIVWNIGWLGLKPFDATLIGLQLTAAIEAIFLTTFVLMSQKSLDAQADKRSDLDLQISLLSEHEITHLLHLVKAIAQKLNIEEAGSDELSELQKDVSPEAILDTLETEKQNVNNGKADV